MTRRNKEHLIGLLSVLCLAGIVACASMDCHCHTAGGLLFECVFPVEKADG